MRVKKMISKLIAVTLTAVLMCPSVVMAESEEGFFREETELALDQEAAGAEMIYADEMAVSYEEAVFDGVTKGDVEEMTYDSTDPVTVHVSSWADLQSELKKNGKIIVLDSDISANSNGDTTLLVPEGTTVTLDLNGFVLDGSGIRTNQNACSVITVKGKLTIEDSQYTKERVSGISYEDPTDNSSIIINGGIIKGGSGTSLTDKKVGGGVYVNGGELTINGGSIACNIIDEDNKNGYGGGVYVDEGGKLTINGGSIVGNVSDIRGGGVCVCDGTVVMNGGTITGNRNRHYNKPFKIVGDGGGVYMDGSSDNTTLFTMNGGTIGRNAAEHGGGVYVKKGSFNMEGGTIEYNKAKEGHGGGVHLAVSGTFNMKNEAKITGNIAGGSGGGVHVGTGEHTEDEPSFTMNGGKIAGNSSQSEDEGNGGGAVSLAGAKTVFEMKGGTIGGDDQEDANRAKSYGGGVFMRDQAFFIMTGGRIIGNNTGCNGGGVCVGISEDATKGKFTISGNVSIAGNENNGNPDDVFLCYGNNSEEKPVNAVINVGGKLNDNTKIGVNVQGKHNRIITKGYKAAQNTEEPFTHFIGNMGNAVVWNPDGTEAVLMDRKPAVQFKKGDEKASGTMNDVYVEVGGQYTLPACGFSAPDKKAFKEWSVVVGGAKAVTMAPNDKITVTTDTVVTAVWLDLEQVASPVFSPAGGKYVGKQSVKITCATTGARIYYTTDGKTPTTGSTLYNGEISVSDSTTIKAIAVKSGMVNSEVSSAVFTINEPESEPLPTPAPSKVSIKDATVKLSKTSFSYNGKEQKPSVTSVTLNGKTLSANRDYSVSWSNSKSKKPGKYKVTITGMGNYTDQSTVEYKIEKGKNPLTIKLKNKPLNVPYSKLKKGNRTIKLSKYLKVSKGQGKVTYKITKGNKKITIDKKTGKITVKKGLTKGTRYVTIAVKAAGNKNYKPLTKKVTVKIVIK